MNLASVIQKESAKYRTELFRNIDFGIFSKDFELLLLIELNDKSHMQRNRKIRDNKIKNILKDCNIPFLTFYTSYSNEESYVVNRIKQVLNSRF